MNRRHFIGTFAATAILWPKHCAAAPFPVRFRKLSPYEALAPYILPGNDDFGVEKTAAEITSVLDRLHETRALPISADFRGGSPLPVRYRPVAEIGRASCRERV